MKTPPEPPAEPNLNPLSLMDRERCSAALRRLATKLDALVLVPPAVELSDLAVEFEIAGVWLSSARRRVLDARERLMGADT